MQSSGGRAATFDLHAGSGFVSFPHFFLPTVTAGSIAPLSPSDMKLRIRSDTLRGCRAASGPPALAKSPQPPPLPFSFLNGGWRRGEGERLFLRVR